MTTGGDCGASREEWEHFAHTLGLIEDLLPVVSNPQAKIAAESKLKALGKVPSRYNFRREAVGIADWTSFKATDRLIGMWKEERDYGICIQTRRVRAIDVDLEVADAVADVEATVRHVAEIEFPARVRGGSNRLLLAFACPGSLAKRVIRTDLGIIELLADGQQFIAAGRHTAGERYAWRDGLPLVLPEITLDRLELIWKELGGAKAKPARPPRTDTTEGDSAAVSVPDPVVDWLVEHGWVTEMRGLPIGVRCPWASDHSGDSGPSETGYWPAGTGGYECGHFKCLHAHCEHRTDGDFLEAIGYRFSALDGFEPEEGPAAGNVLTAGEVAAAGADRRPPGPLEAVYTALTSGAIEVPGPTAAWRSLVPGEGLTRGKKGFQATLKNLVRALDTPGFWYRVGFDEFRMELAISPWGRPQDAAPWRPLEDIELIRGREALEREGFEPVGRELMRDAVQQVAHARAFDSLKLWCGRLHWDGVDRVSTFLQDNYGAADIPYTTAVNHYWWTALAGRALDPGCQVDMVPILTGPEGLRKTRGIEALAPWPDAYTTIDLSHRDDDLARRMRGACIWEINELRGLHSKDQLAINSFITERRDKWVPKYMEFSVWSPRRGLFIGTTNEEQFLGQEYGNRRWLPVAVSMNGQLSASVRDQLWAQGVALFLADGVAFAQVEQIAGVQREDFRITDEWETDITRWITSRVDPDAPFTIRDVAIGIGLFPMEINRAIEMRLAKCLRALTYHPTIREPTSMGYVRRWRRTK